MEDELTCGSLKPGAHDREPLSGSGGDAISIDEGLVGKHQRDDK
jgi:hypothetical protein